MGRLCYPTPAPPQSCPGRPENCHGARRVWHVFLPSWYKFYWVLARSRYNFDKWLKSCLGSRKPVNGHWRSVAVQIVSEAVISHGAGFILRADERVRVQEPLQICLRSRSKSKNRDKQLTHIVRVIGRFNFISCWNDS
jgi:hypothetical protein